MTAPSFLEYVLRTSDGQKLSFGSYYTKPTEDAKVLLKSISDRYGNIISIARDTATGAALSISSERGRTINLGYDSAGRVSQVQDHIGRTVSYSYNSAGRLDIVTDPQGQTQRYVYDADNRVTSRVDKRGATVMTNQYVSNIANDPSSVGRIEQQSYAGGSKFQFAYALDTTAGTSTTDVTDEAGIVTRYIYSLETSRLIQMTLGYGRTGAQTTQYVIDPLTGFMTSQTDPLGRKTAYTYDSQGKTLTVTRLAGTAQAQTTSYTYESTYNQITSVKLPNDKIYTAAYDSLGNLTKLTNPLGQTYTATYDTKGNLLTLTNPQGKTQTYAYNQGELAAATDELGNISQSAWDAAGRVIAQSNPQGNVTRYSYDQLDRLITLTDALGAVTQIGYDPNDNLTSVTDAQGNSHGYRFDNRDRYVGYTDPLGKQTSLTRNTAGQIATSTNRNGQVTTYSYDSLARLQATTTPALTNALTVGTSTYAGYSTTYAYDNANRLTRQTETTGSQTSTISYVWDNLDRPTSITIAKTDTANAANNQTSTTAYTYTTNNQRATSQTTGLPQISYTYDDAGQLTRITQAAHAVNNNTAQVTTYAYDSLGRRTQTGYPSGTNSGTNSGAVANYSYDDASRLTGISYLKAGGAVLGNLVYTYDSANRRVSAGGSLLTPKLNSPAVNATYDAANRISTANGQTYVYDKAGMMLSDGLQSYAWNAKGQLTQIKNQSGQITAVFSYDAQGRRDSKTVITSAIANTTTVNTLTSRYSYDGENIVQERMTTGVGASAAVTSSLTSTANPVINSYLHGAGVDEHLGLQTNGSAASTAPAASYSSYHFITDALGSTVQLANPAGAAVVSYSYDAYGNTDINPTPNTPIPSNPFQYTGRENDAINTANAGTTVTPLGLYYYRARYYAPTVGRFISEDPIGLEAGVNTHAYVLGDPVSYRDPSGLIAFVLPFAPAVAPLLGSCSAAIAGLAVGGGLGWMFAKPPANANDPNGPKAPGKPGEAEGFKDPKGGPNWVPNPNGRGNGWEAGNGGVWVPTGQGGSAHGGPHWDVQYPGGRSGGNVYPGGKTRPH